MKKNYQILPFAIAGLGLSVFVRLIHYHQSLWCDEMTALLEYITAPWSKIISPGAGEYVPNNHVLFTLLARLCLMLGGLFVKSLSPSATAALIRLPSLIAGTLIPFALAWPMRRRVPALAIFVGFFAALNPWLVAFSDEARGYSLMILLGIIATNLLPDGQRRWPVLYGITVAAMLYTVQVAGMLVAAHFLFAMIFRRRALGSFVRGSLVAASLSILLLLPMLNGILFYYRHPIVMHADWLDFANQLPRFAFAGEYVPSGIDPLIHIPDPRDGFVYWLLPVLMMIIGTGLAWRRPELKSPVLVMALVTVLFLFVIPVDPEIAQVRFAPWCALWLIFTAAAIADGIQKRWGTTPLLTTIKAIDGLFIFRDIVLLPSQPIRDAMLQADSIAPPKAEIVMALLTAGESAEVYGNETIRHHHLATAANPNDFLQAEQAALTRTGRRPWVIMSYEYMPHDLSPPFWDYFQAHYQVKARLSGRISAVAIYAPRSGV